MDSSWGRTGSSLPWFFPVAKEGSLLYGFFLGKKCFRVVELSFFSLRSGCEDLVADQIGVENLVMILNWSSEAHGSPWVHRQALHFLKEEFLNVMHSPVLYDLTKQYLIQAIRSDFLQVGNTKLATSTPRSKLSAQQKQRGEIRL